MSFNGSARARIRATVIDTMRHDELRSLVSRLETAVDNGYTTVDDDTLDEWTTEVLTERERPEDDEDDDL